MTEADETYCADMVRAHDPDRYLLAMLAPAGDRSGLLTLFAFNHEIAKIRESVSEALLGEMRLQWWRDAIDTLYAGGRPDHAVVRPLGDAIERYRLSRRHFDRAVDGRASDQYGRVPETLEDLAGYARETAAPITLLALEVAGTRDPASLTAGTHAGTAWALTGLIRAMPIHLSVGWRNIPAELSERHDLPAGNPSRPADRARLAAAVRDIAGRADAEIAAARALRGDVPRAAVPPLLAVAFAAQCQRRLRKAGYDPYDPRVADTPPMAAWRLTLMAMRGRY